MADADDLDRAKKSGYAMGYAAGRRKRDLDRRERNQEKSREAFIQRAFLAALPACIAAQGWQRTVNGEKVGITSRDDRVKLAWGFAKAAWRHRADEY